MKQLARRIGRSLAFVLPLVLVTTGTLAVTRVPWAPSNDQQTLTASSRAATASSSDAVRSTGSTRSTPEDVLLARLLQQLRTQDPGAALDSLQQAMQQQPSLTRYCTAIARELGQAAVRKYQGDVRRAQSFARPVCDGSFAAGTMAGAS